MRHGLGLAAALALAGLTGPAGWAAVLDAGAAGSAPISDAILSNLDIRDFGDTSLDGAQDTAEQMLEAWEKQIDALMGGGMAEDDRNALQKARDAVAAKIREAVEKGENWVKDGGIRDTIQKTLGKALDGKVSDADKARVLNLTDKLCNIGADGGRSFAEALGQDGVPLLQSLAVQKLQQEISKALPKDVADNLNAYLQMLAVDGVGTLDPAAKQQLLETVKAAIGEYVPYKNSAETLNTLIQDIYDGKAPSVLDAATDLGKSLAQDVLRDTIEKNLDPALAKPLLAALDEWTKNGGTAGDALQAGLGALIDQYAPGEASAAELKALLAKIADGTATLDDLRRASSTVFADNMNALIDKSGLSPEAKKAAKAAIEELRKNGVTALTTAGETFIHDYVTDTLGEEAGDAAAAIFRAVVTPGQDIWEAVTTNFPALADALATKLLAWVEGKAVAQINKFIASHPALQKIFGILGIDGAGIVNGFKNVWGILQNAPDLKTAFAQIGQLVANGLKQMLANLIGWGIEQLAGMLNNLVRTAIGWLSDKLGDWASKVDNALLKKALTWLQGQAERCKKCAAQKVIGKLSAKATEWVTGKLGLPKPASSQNVVNQQMGPSSGGSGGK